MPADFLHNHKDFAALLRIVAEEMKVQPVLVEKDYWIMHCLYGLQQLGLAFELKGGTSLSKGYRIIVQKGGGYWSLCNTSIKAAG